MGPISYGLVAEFLGQESNEADKTKSMLRTCEITMNSLIFDLICWHFGRSKNLSSQKGADNDRTLILAHRGLTFRHLENTLEAFMAAFLVGADGVESDVQMTRDMVPVVFHDRELFRLTGIDRNIDDIAWPDLRTIRQRSERYPSDYAISTLQEVMTFMPEGKLINVELKETTAMKGKKGIQEVLSVLGPFKSRMDLVISSFEPKILAMVHDADPDFRLALLVDKENTIATYIKGIFVFKYIDYLNPHIDLVNKIARSGSKTVALSSFCGAIRALAKKTSSLVTTTELSFRMWF